VSTLGIAYSGAWYADYLPINTSQTYANTQSSYNVSKILTADHYFDLKKYEAYSPLFLAPTFALNYGLSFAALMAVIVHTVIFNGKEVWYRFKAARDQEPDVFMKLMKKYKDAPDWWYGVLFVFSMALGLATTLAYSTQLPCKFSLYLINRFTVSHLFNSDRRFCNFQTCSFSLVRRFRIFLAYPFMSLQFKCWGISCV